nr:MAG TPA: hypothetical protein [Caudoviricetes sp.]
MLLTQELRSAPAIKNGAVLIGVAHMRPLTA